ncbi:Iron complex outermembrane recepter protein [Pseudoalteromonas carrageenovora]|uniref:Iron complex outermembrane recepter protein n=1 Tax=Pseudoalteromonas carrageenovora IAM 12662 TaxID=1314868 RepID=A0A2K4X9G7_PSEVC|nr:TonB-dependent siderophore receptor [Pseudoalteromonas carrageenovora]MBE0383308.1 iron complex outermembrane recepter protein [Pseudoalteromonas carrageenovora IAM 12662]QBJ71863.1 Iron complex outermembrane recepter protein [Pseudoalteromonas carrageenovora]SOU40965.1 Ligand-gated channel [Pseudoalteromonas carrageenovora IAM 12662]
MKTNTKGLKLTYLSTCLLGLFSSHVMAAEQNQQSKSVKDDAIEKVTVVASRQAYQGNFSPLETPQSELKIDLEALENAGAVSLDQALDLSASVARQNNFGGLWNSFSLRGFVGDENLPSNYLVNGFNAGRGFGGSRDLSGIESVEVLKGPRAALFGRGEPGGTVNLVTKRPTFDTAGEIKLSVGSFDTYRADVDYTTALNDDVAIRLVGFYEDAESFRDTIETTKQGFSPSIVWNINNNSQLIYELEYSDQEVPFDRGVLAIDGELGLIPESRFLGEPGDGPIEADVLGHQLEYIHDFDDNWSILFGANYRDTSMEGFATETGFGGVIDGEVNRFRRYRDFDAKYQVFRTELSGNLELGGFEHRLIMGVDADKFENDQVILRVRGDQYINVFNPVYGAYELPTPTSNTDRVEIQESVGVFIQDQISLTDKLDIRIGARFDDYEQRLNNRLANTNTKQTESRVSPQFGVVYEASDYVSVYGAYGENFRPLSGADANGDGFEPNQSTSAELGVKFTLNDGALFGTVAVFKVEQDNMLVVDDATAFTYAAIGEAQSKGIEIDLTGELTDTLEVWASYAFVDATIENSFFDANFGYTVEAGASLLNVPEQQLSLQLVQSTVLYGKAIKFGGGLLHVGKRNGFFGTDFELPSYTTARAFVNYDVTDAIGITAEVNNLFDETYYTNSFADAWVQPGTPRNVKFSASYKF